MKIEKFENQSWEDLVFEGRNKEFGAYTLRKSYNNQLIRAFLIAVFFFLFVITSQYWSKLFSVEKTNETVATKTIKYTDLAAPPPIDKNTPPPPKLNVPPPIKTIIKFLPPKVTHEEVLEEEEMPTIEEIKQNDTGAENIEGIGDVIFDEPIEVEEDNSSNENQVYTVVEQNPEFDGGLSAMYKFISKHMKYPESARRMDIQGSVFIGFVVNKSGEITNVEVVKGIERGCDEEAIRVIKLMPNWKPGKQNGRAVNVRFIIPIKFKLSV